MASVPSSTVSAHVDRPQLIGALLRVPSNAFVRRIEVALRERFPDIRASSLAVFQHIDHPPGGSRLTTLAQRARMSKQAMIEVVDYLELAGYVERTPDPLDRRAKLVRLTAKGWAVHETATEVGQRVQDEWSASLGEGRFAALVGFLQALGELVGTDPRHG